MHIKWYMVVNHHGNWARDFDGDFIPLQPTRELAETIAGPYTNNMKHGSYSWGIKEVKQPIHGQIKPKVDMRSYQDKVNQNTEKK